MKSNISTVKVQAATFMSTDFHMYLKITHQIIFSLPHFHYPIILSLFVTYIHKPLLLPLPPLKSHIHSNS